MYHHRRGGIGQATVDGGKVPHAAQQGARCAAHQHQGLREEEEDRGARTVRKESGIFHSAIKKKVVFH